MMKLDVAGAEAVLGTVGKIVILYVVVAASTCPNKADSNRTNTWRRRKMLDQHLVSVEQVEMSKCLR